MINENFKYIAFLLFETKIKDKVLHFEEITLLLAGPNLKEAKKKANKYGKKSTFQYESGENIVNFNFLQVIEIKEVIFEPEDDFWHISSFFFDDKTSYFDLKAQNNAKIKEKKYTK